MSVICTDELIDKLTELGLDWKFIINADHDKLIKCLIIHCKNRDRWLKDCRMAQTERDELKNSYEAAIRGINVQQEQLTSALAAIGHLRHAAKAVVKYNCFYNKSPSECHCYICITEHALAVTYGYEEKADNS